jgi:hypothetical protein
MVLFGVFQGYFIVFGGRNRFLEQVLISKTTVIGDGSEI